MTPQQKEMLVRALLTDRLYPNGSEYHTIKALHRKGWTTEEWWIGRGTITQEGRDALQLHSKPIELFPLSFQTLLLIKGEPVAEVLPGKQHHMENLLANTDL